MLCTQKNGLVAFVPNVVELSEVVLLMLNENCPLNQVQDPSSQTVGLVHI